MEMPLAALYRALEQRLTNSGDAWGGRVHAERMPPAVIRPYVVYQWQAGGQRNRLIRPDAEIVIAVRVVAESQAEAFPLGARLAALLDDMGEQDARRNGAAPLNGGADWHICTTTQETQIHLSEFVDSKIVTHEGFTLRVVMDSKV